jgi:outer membrane protein OmpA-like peptidoglycan-associated protein
MSKRRIGGRASYGSCLAGAIALVGALALGACSSSHGEKVIEPDKAEKKSDTGPDTKAAAQKAENANYPNLGDVPKRPPVTPPDQRIIIEEGLLADRANARHTDQAPRWASDTGNNGAPAAEVKPAATGNQVASTASPVTAGAAAQIGTIAFAEDAATLPPSGKAVLEHIVTAYRAGGGTLRVVGHTTARQRDADPEKDKLAKLDLSLARANAVAVALTDLGVARDKIVIAGRGDTEPAAPPGDSSRATENARVDVFLDK